MDIKILYIKKQAARPAFVVELIILRKIVDSQISFSLP